MEYQHRNHGHERDISHQQPKCKPSVLASTGLHIVVNCALI